MIRAKLSELTKKDHAAGHFLGDLLPGAYLTSGGLSFAGRGDRSHTNDGPDGKDYHVHRDREAFIILQGTGTMEIDGQHHPVASGDIIIVEPGEDHHLCSSEEDPIVTVWCHAGENRHHNQS